MAYSLEVLDSRHQAQGFVSSRLEAQDDSMLQAQALLNQALRIFASSLKLAKPGALNHREPRASSLEPRTSSMYTSGPP